jgi:hypothetical protein
MYTPQTHSPGPGRGAALSAQEDVPRLATLQPREAPSGVLGKLKRKVGWERAFTLAFLCEAPHDGHNCSPSEGVAVTLPGPALVKLAPLLRVAAAVLQAGALAARVYGLPVPVGGGRPVPALEGEQLEALVAAAAKAGRAAGQAAEGGKLAQRAAPGEGGEGVLARGVVRELLRQAGQAPVAGGAPPVRVGGLTKRTSGEHGVVWLCPAHAAAAAAATAGQQDGSV